MRLYNLLLEKILLPLGDVLTGASMMKDLRQYRKYSKMSSLALDDLAKQNLSKILEYAVLNVPYYSKIEKNIDPYLWLKSFPIMKKQIINDNLDKLLIGDKTKLIACSGSGSSGIRGTVYMSSKEQSTYRAIQTHWWEWSGYYIGKKLLQTGMAEKRTGIKRLKDLFFRTKYVRAFKHSEADVLAVLRDLDGKSGYTFGGYASSLNVFSTVAAKYSVKNVKFDQAISWGDKLFDHYKKNVKESFDCVTFETYGCSEGIMVAAKKDLDYFYIMSPHVCVEIVDENGNEVPDGEIGFVLLTRLDNFSMPLIRYYIGDLAVKLPKDKYPKDRELNYPLLEKVIGRDTDIVKTHSGKSMIVHFFTGIFENIQEIKQFRVIQHTLDGINIEYIPSESFNENCLDRISGKIQEYINEPFLIQWKNVDFIPPTASGKPQIIQSFIKKI